MRLSDLQSKEVVNIVNGKAIGKIIDIVINEDGKMAGLIVEKYKFLVSMFSNKDEVEIKWHQIDKIGEDVILVNINMELKSSL